MLDLGSVVRPLSQEDRNKCRKPRYNYTKVQPGEMMAIGLVTEHG